jgi:hypothetical protein
MPERPMGAAFAWQNAVMTGGMADQQRSVAQHLSTISLHRYINTGGKRVIDMIYTPARV